VAGDAAIPTYTDSYPGSVQSIQFFSPGQQLVITHIVVNFYIDANHRGWICGEDVEKFGDAGLYKVINHDGAVLFDNNGEETGQTIPYDTIIDPKEIFIVGYVQGYDVWIEMKYLAKKVE
jgi:hypothetical protein